MPPDNPEIKESNEKTSLKEFWNISKWSLFLSFKLDALHTTYTLITQILMNFRGIIGSLIFAKVIDVLIKISQSPNPSLKAFILTFFYL
jgi:hypothetical protein